MNSVIYIIKRYMYLLYVFAKLSLISQMEYRINFISGIAVETGYLLAKIVYVIVIYQTGVVIDGMKPDTIIIFIGCYILMTGIYMSFYPNFVNIPGYIRDGTLDLIITKPVSLQFIATFKYIDFGMPIPNILGGVAIICTGWHRTGIPVTFTNVIGFMLFILIGTILTYTVFLIPTLFSFWIISGNGVRKIASGLWDFNNMPMVIYQKSIQRIGIFVIPIFLISNFPALFILNKLSNVYIIWGILSPVIFLTIASSIWKAGIKNYTSASS